MTQSSLDHLSGGALSAVLPDGSGTAWSVSFQERIDVAPNLGPSGTLYVGTAGGDLVALDAADGTERWRFETTDGAVSAPALTGDETIVVGTGAGRVHAVNADGSLRWTYDTGSTSSSAPALAPDGTVYIGSDDGRVWAIDATGSLEWSYPTGGPVRAVPALGPGGEVYVGSDDGHLYALSGGGQLRWKYPTGGPVTAGAAVTTHVSPFDPLLPGIQQTETVVYFGSSDGTVYAVNAGGTFTSSMPGTLRWSVGTDHPIEHAPALDLGTQTLYVSSGPRLWAFGGQPSGGTGLVQITSLGTVLDPELLELRDNIHILVALAGEGGFGGSAILGGLPEDPCQGGPLFIPDCTELRSGLGTATPLVEVPSLVDLQIGFVKEGFGDAVLGGDPDGLLSTYTTVLRDGGTYTGILAGTTHPELLAPNPDGLPTRLTVFEAPTGTGFGTGEPVYVGHFSTDLGTVEIRLSGSGTYTFGPLRYGELSDLAFVEPGAYEIQVVPLDGVAGKRRAALAASADLASVAGGPTGLLLAGFADPEANLDGPGLTMYRADGGGATEVIGVTTGSEAELPQHVTLEPAYPNPFNPVTVIAYTLPNERDVRLEVFDVLGRSMARLVDGPQAAGRHEVSFDAGRLAGGVYLVRLSAGRQVATRAVTLLK
jgi:outer membrane protein assembly factor BamB